MNDHEEQVLRAVPLRAPSAALDERIEKLLATEPVRKPVPPGRAVPLWQLAVACAACAACAFLAGMLVNGKANTAPASAEVRYIIQLEPGAYNVFDWTTYPKKIAPISVLKTEETEQETASEI